jgi:predicted RNA-binding Zn ribbon-like protein
VADAPGDLEILRNFLNTHDIEDDVDLGPAQMTDWLRERELLGADESLSADDRERAAGFREALRDVLEIEHEDERRAAALELLNATAESAPLRVRFESAESASLVPVAGGVDGAIARMLGFAYASIGEGTWSRLKTCKRDSCRWVFYDQSRNRSRNWCSMETCGNRTKVERFRSKDHSH